jgi:hypothetical protein
MSNGTRLPPFDKTVYMEADIPINQRDEVERAMREIVAGVYNGAEYPPFDLTELRGLDTELASACLDYLKYDRLGKTEVHKHLANVERDLHRWLEEYGIEPAADRS